MIDVDERRDPVPAYRTLPRWAWIVAASIILLIVAIQIPLWATRRGGVPSAPAPVPPDATAQCLSSPSIDPSSPYFTGQEGDTPTASFSLDLYGCSLPDTPDPTPQYADCAAAASDRATIVLMEQWLATCWPGRSEWPIPSWLAQTLGVP